MVRPMTKQQQSIDDDDDDDDDDRNIAGIRELWCHHFVRIQVAVVDLQAS